MGINPWRELALDVSNILAATYIETATSVIMAVWLSEHSIALEIYAG